MLADAVQVELAIIIFFKRGDYVHRKKFKIYNIIKMVFNYVNAKIYIITKNGSSRYILGSTTQTLDDRLKAMKAQKSKEGMQLKNFLENAKIKLIQNYPCYTKEELNKRVKYHQIRYKIKQLREQGRDYQIINVLRNKLNTMYRPSVLRHQEPSLTLDWGR